MLLVAGAFKSEGLATADIGRVLVAAEVAMVIEMIGAGVELGAVMFVTTVATPKENTLDEGQQVPLLSTQQQKWPSPHDDTRLSTPIADIIQSAILSTSDRNFAHGLVGCTYQSDCFGRS